MIEGIISRTKGWKRVYVWLFFTIPFLLFIMEEAVQTLGFGRYMLTQGKLWEEALAAISIDRQINTFCLVVSIISFPLNPLAGGVFSLYFMADRYKIAREVIRIEHELWGYSNHSIPEQSAMVTAISRFGGRKLALLVIAATILIILTLMLIKRERLPKGRREKHISWSETQLRVATRQIGLDEDEFIEFLNDEGIPLNSK